MRPISMEMHAFGPYAGIQKLDFRELGDRSLFLIHGPTGSGKSTILDAICLALYGETSGKERDGGQMRSDLAAHDLKTRVVFEFTIGDEIYKIDRTPRYDVPREAGERPRTITHTAEMWRRSGPEDEAELIGGRVGEVAEQVERLLGLRADQFRQVVVLPQGRFRELLTASSNEREKIFSTLFQTDHYRLIQDRLKEKARGIRDELERQSEQRQNFLQMAEAESLEELSAKIAGVEKQIAELTERRTKREAVVREAQETLRQAVETDRKLTDARAARERVAELDEQRPEIDTERNRLDRAKKAATLAEAERHLKDRISEAETSEKARDELEAQVGEAKEALAKAEQEKQATDELRPQINELTERHRTLEGLRPRISRLAEAEEALSDARTKASDLESAWQSVHNEHQRVTGEQKTVGEHLVSARLQAGTVDGLSGQVTELKRLVRQRRQLDDYQQDFSRKLDEQDTAKTALEVANDRLRDAQETLDVLEETWRQGQAAVLAGQLEDETPCPVCGSIHHPSPATSDDAIPDEQQLERHRQAVETTRDNLRQASNNKVKLDEQVRTLTGQVDSLLEELGDVVDSSSDDLEQRATDAEHELTVARGEAGKVEELSRQVDGLSTRVESLQRQVNEAQEKLEQARLAENSARTAYDNALGEVPEEYRSLEALDSAITAIKAEIENLNERVESATNALADARSEHDRLSAEFRSARSEAGQDRERADREAEEFAGRRLEQGFADDRAYLDARLPDEQIDQLETAIKQYDDRVNIARDRLKTTEENAAGLEQPDLDTLQGAVATAEEVFENTRDELSSRRSQHTSLEQAVQRVDEIRGEIERLDSEYSVAEYLSSVANGEAAYSRHRISFERFVLGTFLDEVLVVATEKLRTMTSGRYQLLRKLYGSDGRRSTGLDLEVEDAHTGVARDVSTLSGGEGFLAALALALGLSEVVQNRAGGIRLQTLFVDEGFGSLDPHALDRSLNALIELHHGRLVGIISHVPELQERIGARLRVRPRREGSVAEFVV